MTNDKERMAAGLPFSNAGDGLPVLHLHCLRRLWAFNRCNPARVQRRAALLRRLVPNAGEGFTVQSPFSCDYGTNIYTGKNVYINFNGVILDVGRVSIGDDTMLGPNVAIYAVGHPIHPEPRTVGLDYGQPVSIGSRVWVGGNVVINPGVSIGDGSVIASGSVVTADIPANVVAAGVPCRVLRPITDEDKRYYRKGELFDADCIYKPELKGLGSGQNAMPP